MDPNSNPTPVPRTPIGRLILAAGLLAGCSQSGPLTRRISSVEALKTDVAQLETEKAQLRREVADAQKENRRVAAQLAEVEDENNELATRLNDARAVISRQGLDSDKFSPPARSASDADRANARKSTPAASKSSKNRKTPMAEIRGERRPAMNDRDDLPLEESIEAPGPSRRDSDPFGPQGSNSEGSPWLPVARANSANNGQVR